jgi:hypothetical protein
LLRRNLLAFCAVAFLQSGRLSLRTQILNPLLIILLLLGATAALALRLDLPGTIVAYYSLSTLALLVSPSGLVGEGGRLLEASGANRRQGGRGHAAAASTASAAARCSIFSATLFK